MALADPQPDQPRSTPRRTSPRPPGGRRYPVALMGIKGFERSLENMVEGAFARVFRSGLRPVELGRRLVREMDDNRSVDVRGRTIVPNAFAITVSQDDYDRFAEIGDSLSRELSDAAREHAHDEAYVFMGPVTVDIEASPSTHPGTFSIVGRMKEGP